MIKVLITNDDGYDATGLVWLYRALSPLAEVHIVAPKGEQSTSGHYVTVRSPIPVETVSHVDMGRIHVVDGSPADCVRLGLSVLFDDRFDWVISGINRGANVGVDIYYSGTVAAVREAAIHGVPALAFSQLVRPDQAPHWDRASGWTRRIFDYFLRVGVVPHSFANVTFPAIQENARDPQAVFRPMSTDPLPVVYDVQDRTADSPIRYRYAGKYMERPFRQGTDVEALFSGQAVITLLTLDGSMELSSEQMPPDLSD